MLRFLRTNFIRFALLIQLYEIFGERDLQIRTLIIAGVSRQNVFASVFLSRTILKRVREIGKLLF
jgi:hypothetical protein